MSEKKLFPRAEDLGPYIRAGLQLIPLHKWDALDQKGRPRGKTPRDGAWQAKQYDSSAVQATVQKYGINAGIRLPAEIMVLDVDPRNFGGPDDPDNLKNTDRLAELVKDVGLDLDSSPHTITGSGGHHYWFKKPEDVTLMDSLQDYPGIEFKSLGRQVVAAGSVHPGGQKVVDPNKADWYRWDDLSPSLEDMPNLPGTLLALIRRPIRVHGDTFGGGELTPEMLAETLEQIDPADYSDESVWRDIMMASHHATHGEGRQEFIDWSTGDSEYADHGWLIGRRWDSLHLETGRGGRPVTVKFLHKLIQEAGYEVARTPPEDDFEEWEEVDNPGAGVDTAILQAEPEFTGLEAVLEEMNAKHCVVFDGGKFRIFTEEFDPVLKRPFFQRSTKDDFENLYSNSLVEVGDNLISKSKMWLKNAKRRQYKGVIFDPSQNHVGWLNLWKGWAVEPAKGDWSLLQSLILDVLVDGDKDHYEYVLNWLAYMIQHPERAAEVALCFRGAKGTGKGTLGRAMGALAGNSGLHISSPEHLTGRFNSHLQNCICLFADEAFWAGDKSGEAKLKQLVTEPTIAYEGKGRDATMGKNLIHIIMAANGDWVVPAGMDGERRFAVFEVNTKRTGDRKFFMKLNNQMYKEGGLEALLFDLLTRPLGDWAPRNDVPATQALVKQKIMSMDDVQRWWYSKLMDGFMPNVKGDWHAGSVNVIKEQLRGDYMEYAKELRVFRPADQVAFGMRLGKLVPFTNTQITPGQEDYDIKVDRKGRASAYKLPSIQACRAAFETLIGNTMDWPKDTEEE